MERLPLRLNGRKAINLFPCVALPHKSKAEQQREAEHKSSCVEERLGSTPEKFDFSNLLKEGVISC